MDVIEEAIGWVFIGWMLVVLICAPLAWAWLMWDERRERRRPTDAERQARVRHPASQGPHGPEDDPRWIAWVRGRND